MDDSYNLQRFVDAQDPVFEQVCSELRQGRKTGHWMWFIFPQVKGLGSSPEADKFAISSLEEAKAYLKHPVLGPRLRRCCLIVTMVSKRAIDEIFGHPDNLKFRSSMTLFVHATTENQIFNEVLKKYFQNEPDALTIEQLPSARDTQQRIAANVRRLDGRSRR